MARLLATVIMLVAGHLIGLAQTPAGLPPPDTLHITQGPVIEHLSDATAIIAWSTNINAGTVLHYGISSEHLDQSVGMPWGGLTHRVELKNLKPGTSYFFRAESPHGQGTGETAVSPVMSFQTTTNP